MRGRGSAYNAVRMIAAPPRVCIDCRTLVGGDAECDVSRFHRVVALDTEEGRAQLRAKVWGPPELRQRARDAAKVGGLGAFLDGISCGGCPADVAAGGGFEALAVVIASLVVVFLIFAVAYWVIASGVAWIRRRRSRLRPTGAAPTAGRGERLLGRVAAGAKARPPLGEGEGVAWGVVLESSDAIGEGAGLLFAGASGGFTVELDDGRALEVPAGRARVESARWARASSAEARELAARLDHRSDPDPHPPIPADRARVAVLSVGDRVAITAPVERAPGEGGGYREGASRLVARGVPTVTVALA